MHFWFLHFWRVIGWNRWLEKVLLALLVKNQLLSKLHGRASGSARPCIPRNQQCTPGARACVPRTMVTARECTIKCTAVHFTRNSKRQCWLNTFSQPFFKTLAIFSAPIEKTLFFWSSKLQIDRSKVCILLISIFSTFCLENKSIWRIFWVFFKSSNKTQIFCRLMSFCFRFR